MLRKNLLRTGVVAVALTLAAVFVPASPALADSGGGCYYDTFSGFQACISVEQNHPDPLLGDAWNIHNYALAQDGLIYIHEICGGAAYTSIPSYWPINGGPWHSPVNQANHLQCSGGGFAWSELKLYDNTGTYIKSVYSPNQYF